MRSLGVTARRVFPRAIRVLVLAASIGGLTVGLTGCATMNAVGQGGQVYEVRVASVDGMMTALRGPVGHAACIVQVANRVASVWLAQPSHQDQPSPVIFEADAEALKEGILVERTWSEAIVHQVTDDELAAGAAVVIVPGRGKPTAVELRFDPVSRLSHSDRGRTDRNSGRSDR